MDNQKEIDGVNNKLKILRDELKEVTKDILHIQRSDEAESEVESKKLEQLETRRNKLNDDITYAELDLLELMKNNTIELRYGRILVPDYVVRGAITSNPIQEKLFNAIFTNFFPTKCEQVFHKSGFEYWGFSKQFDRLEHDEETPLYTYTAKYTDAEPVVIFKRFYNSIRVSDEYPNLTDVVKELVACNFTCDAGSIENNQAFIALKKLASKGI